MKPDREINSDEDNRFPVKIKGSCSWKVWLVLLIIIGVLAAIILSITFEMKRDSNRFKAMSHARSCLIAYTEFESEYGARPGQIIADGGKVPGARAETANDCFRQLLQGLATVRSEAIFYAPSRISKQPDNDLGDESNHFAEACAKGEVGFLYVDAPSAIDGAPLMATPLLNTSGMFDSRAYNGHAVILKTDGSVEVMDIDPDTGRIYILVDGEKVDILSSENPLFPSPPTIKYPEPK